MARSPRTHPCLAQPPTEDKSSSRIPPRGCREFSLRLVSRNVEKSFYILSGIDLRPSLSSHLSSLVETSTLIPANFPLTFHFSSFFFFFLFPSRSVYFRPRRACPLGRFGFREREGGFSWWPGDEWWREFGKRGQVRPGLINEVDRIAC